MQEAIVINLFCLVVCYQQFVIGYLLLLCLSIDDVPLLLLMYKSKTLIKSI